VSSIRVLLVDDHELFREGVAELLSHYPSIEIVAKGATAADAVRLSSEHLPDILLLDIGIPGGGLNAVQAVAASSPITKIVMLTASETNLLDALKAGASGYVLKGVSYEELFLIIQGVMAGESYVTPALAAGLLREMSRPGLPAAASPDPLNTLSEREHQILDQVARGLSNREIGLALGLSEKTVKHYMTNILEKLHLRNRVEAAMLASKDRRGDRVYS
jgi:two-component system, NarL family, nitrate/nitrite response regulator NarL